MSIGDNNLESQPSAVQASWRSFSAPLWIFCSLFFASTMWSSRLLGGQSMTEQGVKEAMYTKGDDHLWADEGATRTSSNAVIAATPQLSVSVHHSFMKLTWQPILSQFQSLCKVSVYKVRNLLETFLPLTTESAFGISLPGWLGVHQDIIFFLKKIMQF